MNRRRFDINLLKETINKDGANLIGEYSYLTRESLINFKCKCGNENNKPFRSLVDKAGALCKECKKIQANNKREQNNFKKYGS